MVSSARQGILLFGNGSEPDNLDPNIMAAAVESNIESALFEGLVNIAIDGQGILPGVAERWDISPDQRTYTFHLRSDARWSDGSPVTAGDFEYGFRRVFTPSIGCITADSGYAIDGSYDYQNGRNPSADSVGVRALDPHTLQLRLGHPTPYILYVLGLAPMMPVPKAVVERFGGGLAPGTPWTRPGNHVSNGAFMLKSWQQNANVTVVRNPYYWDRAHVRLSEIRFFPTDNPDTEERLFRTGGLHITYRVPLSKISSYRAQAGSGYTVTPLLATWFVPFNTHRAPFDKVAVRRAFALAIDREELVPKVLHDSGTPAHSLTRPGTGGYTPPAFADHDPALARRLLAEAGYPGGVGFPRVEFLARNSGTDALMAEALQQVWLRELGIRVEIVQQEPKVAINSFHAFDYQVGISGYFYSMQSPELMLTTARSGTPSNMVNWSSPEFDAAFSAAEQATTTAQHTAAVDVMERLISEEAPYAPLYFLNQCQLVHPLLKGFRGNPLQQIDWRELSLVSPP